MEVWRSKALPLPGVTDGVGLSKPFHALSGVGFGRRNKNSRPRRGRHPARPLVQAALSRPRLRASAKAHPLRPGARRRRARRGVGAACGRTGRSACRRSRRPIARKGAPAPLRKSGDREALEAAILHEDADVIVLNKPYGLAVQGGSGLTRHVDQMLEAFTDRQGRKPRLVHRLDRDTAGVLRRRPHALRRRLPRRGVQGARDAKALLGARRRRAAAGRWAHLHLPRA